MLKERLKLIDKWIAIPFIILIYLVLLLSIQRVATVQWKSMAPPNYYLVRQSIVVVVSLIMAFFVYIFPFRVLKRKK